MLKPYMPAPNRFIPYCGALEILFLVLIVLSSLYIYSKTKKIYELSEHKGIKYFRYGFMCFAISHSFLILHSMLKNMIFKTRILENFFLFEVYSWIYLTGILFLISSMFSDEINEKYIYFGSLFIFILGIFFESKFFMIIYSTILIIILGIISIIKLYKDKKKHFSLIYIIYILVFSSWLVSFVGRIFTNIYVRGNIINDILRSLIFLYMAYLVNKKLK